MRCVAAVGVCLLITSSLPARDGGQAGKNPSAGINFYSLDRELALGKQLSTELERQVRLLDDPILAEYVNRVAQIISRRSNVTIPVIVRIIDSADLNAFTLPGGHIYLNSGMLRLTESEAELAFVLAHELGHVAARHAVREASRDRLASLGAIPLSVFGGWAGAALRQLTGPGSRLGLLKGEREFENQADRLGLEYVDRAGYDPEAAVEVFERIEGAERKAPGKIARLSTTHPIASSRIETTQKILSEIRGHREAYIVNTSEYETMRLRLKPRNAPPG